MDLSSATSAVILSFPPPARPTNRFTARDRIEVLRWADSAREEGYTRVALDNSAQEDEPELGDFLLVYRRDALWASWGVGCCDGGFIVWRPADGTTTGWYPCLKKALAAIPPA
ncbi:hypothetical protein [Limobrevibacterium gyesilva]|uniref:Uncharacterized protein n=1 Tax=Limobrevibacterium gyesilva TaxID=2991712 RepID=A0AA41YRC5_9PROT|nr:hypothetical protein [Limobrevibacterium gyesilva]MCW3474102.1 hypothetical protein [Limobrevibacterium gyesilva]